MKTSTTITKNFTNIFNKISITISDARNFYAEFERVVKTNQQEVQKKSEEKKIVGGGGFFSKIKNFFNEKLVSKYYLQSQIDELLNIDFHDEGLNKEEAIEKLKLAREQLYKNTVVSSASAGAWVWSTWAMILVSPPNFILVPGLFIAFKLFYVCISNLRKAMGWDKKVAFTIEQLKLNANDAHQVKYLWKKLSQESSRVREDKHLFWRVLMGSGAGFIFVALLMMIPSKIVLLLGLVCASVAVSLILFSLIKIVESKLIMRECEWKMIDMARNWGDLLHSLPPSLGLNTSINRSVSDNINNNAIINRGNIAEIDNNTAGMVKDSAEEEVTNKVENREMDKNLDAKEMFTPSPAKPSYLYHK